MTSQGPVLPAQKMPDDAIIERIQKIIALGRRGGTEAEAAAAMAKAQKMLAEYNLDMATVERGGRAGDARREQASAQGGMYHYQRDLWRAVAEINFCAYLTSGYFKRRRVHGVERNAWIAQHAFIGRVVNTRATMVMGQYLEGEIERLCRERLDQRIYAPTGGIDRRSVQSQFFSSWAVGFREGAADRVVAKLAKRRGQQLSDERQRAKRAAAMAGASTATALTIGSVAEQEEAANYDFRWGEGSWAQRQLERAQRAEERRREQEEWTRFQAEHPEEARKVAEEARRERRRAWGGGLGSRGGSSHLRKVDSGGYAAGSEAGEAVGLDPQADRQQRRMLR